MCDEGWRVEAQRLAEELEKCKELGPKIAKRGDRVRSVITGYPMSVMDVIHPDHGERLEWVYQCRYFTQNGFSEGLFTAFEIEPMPE